MVLYNLTNLSNANNAYELTAAANQLTGGMYGIMFLIGSFVVVFASTRGLGAQGFFLASFLTAILAVFFRLLNLVPDFVMIVFVLLTGISFVIVMYPD
jgi:hypothetical protein